LSLSLAAPTESSNAFAPSVVVRIHKTLRVEGCPPCGTVLAYTRNGTPGAPSVLRVCCASFISYCEY
jgi:hypothetical protein